MARTGPADAPRERPQLTRELVIRAALTLVDREGADALTMRAVAKELGTKPMSLYTYVSDKEDLLGGMLDLIGSEQTLPSFDPPWQTWLREGLHEVRRSLLDHPNAVAAVVRSTTPLRIGARTHVADVVLAAFEKAGFELETAVHVYRVVLNFVAGSVIRQINSSRSPGRIVDVLATAEQLPTFTRALQHELHPDWNRTFELGVKMLIAGSERLLAEDKKRSREAEKE